MQQNQRRRENQRRFLRALAVAVLFAGLFVQITMLARISGQHKLAEEIEDEIIVLDQTIENLERDINNYYNLPEIEQLARKKGMIDAGPEHTRNITVEGLESKDAPESAGEAGEKANH